MTECTDLNALRQIGWPYPDLAAAGEWATLTAQHAAAHPARVGGQGKYRALISVAGRVASTWRASRSAP